MGQARIGFIGAGLIAGRHAGNLLGFADVRIAAVADPRLDRAESLAEQAGARAWRDWREMLSEETLDAVYICVPPFAHGEPELAAAERGLPFLVEKPVAADLATAERIGDAVAAAGLTTAVGYHWRYLDTVERTRGLLTDHPPHLALGYWLDATPPVDWWVRGDLSGGQMVEQTTHIFDLARHLLGEAEEVTAATSAHGHPSRPDSDIAHASLATVRFRSGVLASFASTCILGWRHRAGLHLFCDGLAIELSEFDLMVDVGQGRPIEPAIGDPMVAEDRDFIDAVLGRGNRIRVPFPEALRTHRLACAAALAAAEARTVRLEELEPVPLA